MSDATQAHTQARLKGKVTWVRLPEHEWPEEWKKNGVRDPVVPLLLALYGHPASGGYRERHCEEHLKAVGVVPANEWKSCFVHEELGLFLVVYLDDFKMA
eukprot:11908211-Alexandrium_andersonii.AAC.1